MTPAQEKEQVPGRVEVKIEVTDCVRTCQQRSLPGVTTLLQFPSKKHQSYPYISCSLRIEMICRKWGVAIMISSTHYGMGLDLHPEGVFSITLADPLTYSH